jgi:hypothetical protein
MVIDPIRLAQAIVKLVLPPACREHVLGDLEERSRVKADTKAGRRQFLIDALRTVPWIVWSQMRRAVPPRLLIAQGLVAYTSFVLAAFQVLGKNGFAFLDDEYGFRRIALPALASWLVLVLADTYSTPREGPPWHESPRRELKVVGLALSAAFLVNFVTSSLANSWAMPRQMMIFGAILQLAIVPPLRFLLKARRQAQLTAAALPRSLEDVRGRAQAFEKEIRRRTLLGTVVTLFVMACFAQGFYVFPNGIQRIGSCVTIAGCLFMLGQLHRKRASAVPVLPTYEMTVDLYRKELLRQRDFHRGTWFWWRIVVFLPGPLLFEAGAALTRPGLLPSIGLTAGVFLILAILGVPLNYQMARKYQRQADLLDMEKP